MDWLLVFLGIALSDIFWVFCVRSVQATNPWASGLWAVGIFVPTALTTVAYVANPWLLIPAGLGHFAGTALPVWAIKHGYETRLQENGRRIAALLKSWASDDAKKKGPKH